MDRLNSEASHSAIAQTVRVNLEDAYEIAGWDTGTLMKTDDHSFSERILAEPASPRVAAECFVQDIESEGVGLTDLQKDVLLVLQYDDIVQVRGLASVVEEMEPDLEGLVHALCRVGCHDHATEIRAILQKLGDQVRRDETRRAEFVREHGDFDDVTMKLTLESDGVRRRVLELLSTIGG